MKFSPCLRSVSPRLRSVGAGLVAVVALGAAGCTPAPSAVVQTDNYANQFDRFPVVGSVSYKNDYGVSRGGGSRRHQGVDVMAKRGQKVLAVESGAVTSKKYSSSCGYSLGISGDDGNYYLYCHMNGYASGIATGKRVWAGKQVGTIGSSGNASYAYPHLHLEMHPNGAGGASRNPYYRLRNAEGRSGALTSPPKGWR